MGKCGKRKKLTSFAYFSRMCCLVLLFAPTSSRHSTSSRAVEALIVSDVSEGLAGSTDGVSEKFSQVRLRGNVRDGVRVDRWLRTAWHEGTDAAAGSVEQVMSEPMDGVGSSLTVEMKDSSVGDDETHRVESSRPEELRALHHVSKLLSRYIKETQKLTQDLEWKSSWADDSCTIEQGLSFRCKNSKGNSSELDRRLGDVLRGQITLHESLKDPLAGRLARGEEPWRVLAEVKASSSSQDLSPGGLPTTLASPTRSSAVIAVAVAVPVIAGITIGVAVVCFIVYRRFRLKNGASLDEGSASGTGGGSKEKDDRPLLNTSWLSRWGDGKRGDATVFSVDACPQFKPLSQNESEVPPAKVGTEGSMPREQGIAGFLKLSPEESLKKLRGVSSPSLFRDAIDHALSTPEKVFDSTPTAFALSTPAPAVGSVVQVSIDNSNPMRTPSANLAAAPPPPLAPPIRKASPTPPPPPPPPGTEKGPPPPPPGKKKGTSPPPGGKGGPPPPPPPPGNGLKPPPPVPGNCLSPLRLPSPGVGLPLKPASGRVLRMGSGKKEALATKGEEPIDSRKLKPLHWDKLKPAREHESVWNNLLNGSFELDTHQMETLFQYVPALQPKSNKPSKTSKKEVPKTLIEPRKAHNISIQLRGLGLTTDEVCEALLEGDETIPTEILEKLSKMSLSDDEERKIQGFTGPRFELGPAEKFLQTLLEIPNAFQRINTMLFRASFKDDLLQLEEAIAVLQMACKEVKGSRSFVKLLEAVLKTGNQLNMGTFRGDAEAFKLETLLRLADIKGTDGKTSLLHFVIQEIIRAEEVRATRLLIEYSSPTSRFDIPPSISSSPLSAAASSSGAGIFGALYSTQAGRQKDLIGKIDTGTKHLGLKVVTGLSADLANVKRAAGLDTEALANSMTRLSNGLRACRIGLRKYFKSTEGGPLVIGGSEETDNVELSNDVFNDSIMSFVTKAEIDVSRVQKELIAVLESVKSVGIYFYGENRKNDPPLRVFQVVKDFLVILDRACKEVATQVQNQNKKPPVSMPFPPTPQG